MYSFEDDGDGEDYGDSEDITDQASNQKQSNSVDLNAPKAYFKLSDYTETVKVGDNVTLKCDVMNTDGMLNMISKSKLNCREFLLKNSFLFYISFRSNRFLMVQRHYATLNLPSFDSGCC